MLVADARGRQMNPIQRLLFSAASRDPQTAALFHRYAERSIPPRRLLAPRTLGARRGRVCGRAPAVPRPPLDSESELARSRPLTAASA
jgi:hypothetical protein